MAGTPIDDEKRKQLYELWLKGATMKNSAEATGVSFPSVSRMFKEFDIEAQKNPMDRQKYILESVDALIDEFEKLYQELRSKMLEWKDNDEMASQYLSAAKIIVCKYELAMKKHGLLKMLATFKQTNITTVTNFNTELNQYLVSLGAKEENGRIVIDNPKPELIEVLKSARKKKSQEVPVSA